MEKISSTIPNELDGLNMEEVTVFGMGTKPSMVSHGSMVYDENNKVLKIQGLTLSMKEDWQITITM